MENTKAGWRDKDGHFIRKGEVEDWKAHFSPSINDKMDKWIDDNLKGSDLRFVYEAKL